MTDKRKKLARALSEKTGMSHQGAINALTTKRNRGQSPVDLSALAEAVTALEIALEIEQPLGDLHAAHPSEYAVPSAEVEGELKALADAVGVPAPKAVRS